MIKWQWRTLILSVIVLSVAGLALAQQGWARLQSFNRAGADSGISAVYYGGDDIWVVGSHGLIARSHDDGQSFVVVNQGIDANLNDVTARRDKICVVGDAGSILRSTDSGRSFVKILRSTRRGGGATGSAGELDLYSVQFADDEHVFIVGDRGLILMSSDGGA